ncbi:hypothetical protein BDZ89DRAFT_491113 [Hymenopellis radicata]|nr:hypothetical protein BDZ89DRAFT_491113 [Hymenopellis radicata]
MFYDRQDSHARSTSIPTALKCIFIILRHNSSKCLSCPEFSILHAGCLNAIVAVAHIGRSGGGVAERRTRSKRVMKRFEHSSSFLAPAAKAIPAIQPRKVGVIWPRAQSVRNTTWSVTTTTTPNSPCLVWIHRQPTPGQGRGRQPGAAVGENEVLSAPETAAEGDRGAGSGR